MNRKQLTIFLSGRVTAFFVLIVFQIIVVRKLSIAEYARYSLVFAVAYFVQTTTSFGIPRLISKYLSAAGQRYTSSLIKTFTKVLIIVRLITSALVLALIAVVVRYTLPAYIDSQGAFLIFASLYIMTAALFFDADSMAQALMLQTISRRTTLGEPFARLLLLVGLQYLGAQYTASTVLAVSSFTAAVSFVFLVRRIFVVLSQGESGMPLRSAFDVKELIATGIGAYASALAWFVASPAVTRVVASRMLSLQAFAGFGFVQSLVISIQRYTPGQLLFPFIEPAVMGDMARTNDPNRLKAILSLLTKIDAASMGLLIVVSASCGEVALRFITEGKYTGAAIFVPWLLALILANSCYRSYEIAAVSFGVPHALTRAMPFSLLWLGVIVLSAQRFGVWPLLLCPLADAFTRLSIIQRGLAKRGFPSPIDFSVLVALALVTLGISIIGHAISSHLSSIGACGVAAASALAFVLICCFAIHPLREAERRLISPNHDRLRKTLSIMVRREAIG